MVMVRVKAADGAGAGPRVEVRLRHRLRLRLRLRVGTVLVRAEGRLRFRVDVRVRVRVRVFALRCGVGIGGVCWARAWLCGHGWERGGGGRSPRKLVTRAWVWGWVRVHARACVITHLPSCGNPREDGQEPALISTSNHARHDHLTQGHAWVSSVACAHASERVCVPRVACARASVRVT